MYPEKFHVSLNALDWQVNFRKSEIMLSHHRLGNEAIRQEFHAQPDRDEITKFGLAGRTAQNLNRMNLCGQNTALLHSSCAVDYGAASA